MISGFLICASLFSLLVWSASTRMGLLYLADLAQALTVIFALMSLTVLAI